MARKSLFAVIALLATTTSMVPEAHATGGAYCSQVYSGVMVINHRTGFLYGKNFVACVACTRFTPIIVRWPGGQFCAYSAFYGRNYFGQPFSCRVLAIGYR